MSARMLPATGREAPAGTPAVAQVGVSAGASAGAHVAAPLGSPATRAAARAAGRTSLHIDWTACDGRGLCTELLPELLHRDEWGYPLALGSGSDVPVPGHLLAAAADAVSLCPRLALTLSRTVS